MRIALISSSFLPAVGGAELVVHNLAMEWGRQGHEVCVFNWSSDRPAHPDASYGVQKFALLRSAPRFGYHRFPWGRYTSASLSRLLNAFAPDFISAHMGYPTAYYVEHLLPQRPYVVTCHGSDLTHFDWGFRQKYDIDAILRNTLEHSAGAIAISSFARGLMEELGVSPGKIRDIPNGVDLRRFGRKSDFDVRNHFDLSPRIPLILSVGREHAQKDYATGIRAFARVAAEEADVHYLILGSGTGAHGELARELGIGERVTLCEGLQGDELVAAYQQATLFFSPSIWEMMPLVVLEAMATGRPSVVTNVSGSQDLVTSGENGFVVEPRDDEAMATRLLQLLRDAKLCEEFTKAMLQRAEDHSWDRISRLYLQAASAGS